MENKNERIVNLTPHTISVELGDGVQRHFVSAGVVRLQTKSEPQGSLDGIPLVRNSFGDLSIELKVPNLDLKDKVLITSALIAPRAEELKAKTGASLVVAPDTSPASVVRDDQGRIVAVRRFVVLA